MLTVSSHKELPLRMRTLGPPAQAGGAPRIAYPPPDARLELGAREPVPLAAAGGVGRLRWLVDGKPLDGAKWTPDSAGEMRARRGRRCRPFQRRHGADRQAALTASTTDASSSTAKATLIDPVGARIAEEARQQRAGHQPQHVDRDDDDDQHRDLDAGIERQPAAQQHEAGEQRRHRRIALGIDQRQAEARR